MNTSLRVPQQHGEFFCSLSLSGIMARLEENLRVLQTSSFQIGGMEARAFRSLCREELSALLPGNHGNKPRREEGQRIILSGHQPLFNHPGTWIKNFLLDRVAGESGALAVNLEVDSDAPGPLRVPFPGGEGTLKVVWEELGSCGNARTLESVPAPTREEWVDFINRARAHLKTIPNPRIAQRLDILEREGMETLKEGGLSLSMFLTRLRRGYEGPAGLNYEPLPLSSVCATNSFLCFFLAIAHDAEVFCKVHNDALEDYRVRHKLRSKANPFPDLQCGDGRFELPFWRLDEQGVRRKVFAVFGEKGINAKGDFSLYFEGRESLALRGDAWEESIEKLRTLSLTIRPRALALTLFFRLFYCDLFIHGIGGAKYDEASDFIIREYFRIVPPAYLAASLTLFPDFGIQGAPEGEMERLQNRARDLKFKPERFVNDLRDEEGKKKFLELLARKKALLDEGQGEKGGKEFFRRVHEVNEALASFLEPVQRGLHDRMEQCRREEEEARALKFREYPFFLFDPLELGRVIEDSIGKPTRIS